MWLGEREQVFFNLHNEQRYHQCSHYSALHKQVWTLLFCISCVRFRFPQFFQNRLLGMFVPPLAVIDQDLFYSRLHCPLCSGHLIWYFSKNSPSLLGVGRRSDQPSVTGLASASPTEEVAGFAVTPTTQTFLVGFLRKVYTNREDKIKVRLLGGRGILTSGFRSTQRGEQGLQKGTGETLIHLKVNSACSFLRPLLTLEQPFLQACPNVWAAEEEARTGEEASGDHSRGGNGFYGDISDAHVSP